MSSSALIHFGRRTNGFFVDPLFSNQTEKNPSAGDSALAFSSLWDESRSISLTLPVYIQEVNTQKGQTSSLYSVK